MGIRSEELRKIFFDSSVVSTLFFLVFTHLNPLSTTTGGQGKGGTGRNESRSDQRGRRQKCGAVRGAGATDGYRIFLGRSDGYVPCFFSSTLFVSSSCSSSFQLSTVKQQARLGGM